MERDTLITFRSPIVPVARPAPWSPFMRQAINPPTSIKMLESLATSLTPPRRGSPKSKVQSRDQDDFGLCTGGSRTAPTDFGPREAAWAYEACAQVIKLHSKSFYFSARLLPPGKRRGITALYAFSRLTDNLVDEAGAAATSNAEREIARVKARLALESWARANSGPPKVNHPVVVAWADTRNRFGVPQALAGELIEGVRMDLAGDRYDTWDDLWLYCYRVASTVGLMSLYITGAETMQAVPHAVQLGVALQLTNILRDVGEDARAGRVYLPREDMERFGYTEEMLMEGRVNDRFKSLMDFEIARAHALYDAAWPGIAMLPADSRLAVAAAGHFYRRILDKIPAANYDVFNHRAHLTVGEKLRALPQLWLKLRIGEA